MGEAGSKDRLIYDLTEINKRLTKENEALKSSEFKMLAAFAMSGLLAGRGDKMTRSHGMLAAEAVACARALLRRCEIELAGDVVGEEQEGES